MYASYSIYATKDRLKVTLRVKVFINSFACPANFLNTVSAALALLLDIQQIL